MQSEDVKKLANMARIDMSEVEMEGIAKDFDSILAYVSQIEEVYSKHNQDGSKEIDKESLSYFLDNITREDIVTNNGGGYTNDIVKNMPDKEDGYLKVKQIL